MVVLRLLGDGGKLVARVEVKMDGGVVVEVVGRTRECGDGK